MQEQPATYATSFHLPEGERRVLAEMVRRFPSITVMDVDALMTQVGESWTTPRPVLSTSLASR